MSCSMMIYFFGMKGKVLDQMNLELSKQNLFAMHPSKALSVDGLSVVFFWKFWSIVGDAVTVACLDFLNNRGNLG